MKVAFLGKGGSGKSTLATHAVRHLRSTGYAVLAIDADHNMDLSYNLGAMGDQIFLGSDPALIKRHIGVSAEASFTDALAYGREQGTRFSLDPVDPFTARVVTKLDNGLLLITAGPHTDAVRIGGDCSHSLAAPLKAYLPLLTLAPQQAVVIDERAGTDPVATGILNGIDRAVIVVEPTAQSIRVGCQISHELSLAAVPHLFAINKAGDEDSAMYAQLPFAPAARVPFSRDPEALSQALQPLFAGL